MRHRRPALDFSTMAGLALGLALGLTPAFAQTAAAAPAAPSASLPPAAAAAWVATRTRAHTPAYAVATDAGAMPGQASVHIAVTLQLRDTAALAALTDRSQAPGVTAPVLSSQQFLDRHAPTREQIDRVVAYLHAGGFQNIAAADNRLLVTADGTHAQIRAAFQADLHSFDVQGRRAFANVTDAKVPATLADTVLAVVGLQTVHMAHTNSRRAAPNLVADAAGTSSTTLSVVGVDPTQFARIYGADGMPSAATATIGVITQGSMTQTVADLQTAAANAGYPAPSVNVVTIGAASNDTAGVDEWNLDTQTALAAAGGTVRGLVLYTATTLGDANITSAYNRAVSDNLARVINVSLGECETSANYSGVRASNDQIFQAAIAQGQTFSVASGDAGSYECGGSSPSQSYPAASPYVMAIGGTTLLTSGGGWSGETAWSCSSPSACSRSGSGGTGGGVSLTEAAPSWQTAAGVLTTPGKRGIPDLSFDGAPASGARILVNGSYYQIGGTSLSAPLFTGFYSRIQAAHGNALGFPASALYAGAAGNPSWFHDVTSGSNGGYNAASGWDYVTGFGSLQVQNFSSALGGGGGGSPPSSPTWTTVGSEGQSFTVGGTQTVRYGNGSSWITRTLTGSGTCSNDFFGNDPAWGIVKQCQVSSVPVGWTKIAGEGQSFSVSGTQAVRYGSGSSWITTNITAGGTCSNGFFGNDPAWGIVKECDLGR